MTNKFLVSEEQIKQWICCYLSDNLELGVQDIDHDTAFDRFGLDSAELIGMVGDLEDDFDIEIDPTMILDYPTISKLAEAIMMEQRADFS